MTRRGFGFGGAGAVVLVVAAATDAVVAVELDELLPQPATAMAAARAASVQKMG